MFGCRYALWRTLPSGYPLRLEHRRDPVEGRNAWIIADFRICEQMDLVRNNARFGIKALIFSAISMNLEISIKADGA